MVHRLALFLSCIAVTGPALAADHPRIHIFGPKGCSFLEGLGGDGAVFHALDDDHLILDHEVMEGTTIQCFFDGMFSLVGAPGKVESLTGTCESNEGGQRTATFRLEYADADHATLSITGFDQPIPFTACNWP